MFLLFEHHDDVTGLKAGLVVSFATEDDLLPIVHSFFDLNLKYLLFGKELQFENEPMKQ